MIKVINLTKCFNEVTAVNNISFKVGKGVVFGLLGENGAGKTTTLRMLATMLKPTKGTAKINGYDINKDPSQVRENIGILFGGETGLYDRLTARENITYFALLNGMDKKRVDSKIESIANRLEMKEYLDEKTGELSKGMKQKVSLVRSIIHNPSIMFFDEPTSGLDVTAVRTVHRFIKELKGLGKTIIFSSHSMNEIEKLCDKVGIINKGKLIEVSTLESLRNKYKEDDLEEIFVSLIGDKNE